MSSLDILRSIYKPYRYTLYKGVTIIESTSGKFVIKKQEKDLFGLFNYLETRGFTNMPKLVRNYRNLENVFEYVNEDDIPKEQKLDELVSILATLHNKTVYFKTTSIDNYKEIKELIDDNIHYMKYYYEGLFLNICKEEYQSPSKYLFARNYYKIRQSLNFCADNLDKWYESVQNNHKERVAVVHNNLSLDHFRYNNHESKLISWDNYKIDTPIIDFIHLYQKEYLNYDFSNALAKYLNHFDLLDTEKDLLFILLNLPPVIEFNDNELKNVNMVKNLTTYIYKTEELTRPYYTKEKIE